MVLEVALIDVIAGQEDAFAAAYLEARKQIESAEGSRSIRMTRGIETPTRFVLLVEWDSVEAHDGFRASEAFGLWRGLIGPTSRTPRTSNTSPTSRPEDPYAAASVVRVTPRAWRGCR